MKKRHSSTTLSRASVSRGFNTLGLMSTYIQWMWVAIICIPSLLASNLFENNTPADNANTQISIANRLVDLLGPYQAPIGVIVLILTLLLIIYAIKRSPGVVASSTDRALDSTTDYIMPTLTHGKKVSRKKQRQMSVRIQFLIKCSFSLLAFVVLPFTVFLPVRTIDMSLIIAVGLLLLPWSFIWFTLARVLQIEPMKIRN